MQLNYSIFLIIFGISFPTLSQKIIQEDYYLPTGKRAELQLNDLVQATNEVAYRFWINPDLVIEIEDDVILSLYTSNYEKKSESYECNNVKKYELKVNPDDILNYLEKIKISQWNYDELQEIIFDGNRITIEYSTDNSYRIFYLHEPMDTRLPHSRETLEMLNYLDSKINIDSVRIHYYQGLIESSENKKFKREAKRRIKSMEHYHKNYQKLWKEMNFPTMSW